MDPRCLNCNGITTNNDGEHRCNNDLARVCPVTLHTRGCEVMSNEQYPKECCQNCEECPNDVCYGHVICGVPQ